MTRTQTEIVELFRTLPAPEQEEVMKRLAAYRTWPSFYDRMSPEQRAELDQSIAEADRGEGMPATDALDDIARKLGFKRSA